MSRRVIPGPFASSAMLSWYMKPVTTCIVSTYGAVIMGILGAILVSNVEIGRDTAG